MSLQTNATERLVGLARRVCVATGSGSGIVARTARELALLGGFVALIDRDGDSAGLIAEGIRSEGGNAEAFRADVKEAEDVADAAEQIREVFGECQILVNNAAVVGYGGMLIDNDIQLWTRTLDVNLTGALICAQTFGRQMISAGRGQRGINLWARAVGRWRRLQREQGWTSNDDARACARTG
jgi:NAD(P)-dependent dehydrogenase (short-subunit alcohol dehydrogenase family)